MIIDKKYEFKGHNPCKEGSVVSHENAFIIKASDIAALYIIDTMIQVYSKTGASQSQLEGVLKMRHKVAQYQEEHGTKVPDVNDCEIKRVTE